MKNSGLQSIFQEADISKELSEASISDKIRKLENADEFEVLAELMAFGFVENYEDKDTGWGTYFGPFLVMNNGDGTASESPSITLVTPEMIDYWFKRSTVVTSPFLKARYLGLVWDFQERIKNEKPDFKIAIDYIESLISIGINKYGKYETDIFLKLKRALKLAISINNQELVEKSKKALIEYEKVTAIDSKAGLWGYAFDNLVLNKKVNLTEDEEKSIIKDLEDRLSRLSESDDIKQIDPWAATSAATKLGDYYSRKNLKDEVKRVILKVGQAYDRVIGEASPLQAYGWLESTYNIYLKYQLNDEAELTLKQMREIGPKVNEELKPISHDFTIPTKEIEEYLNHLLTGELPAVLKRLTVRYIPRSEEAKEQIFKISKNAPLQFLITQQIQDAKGRVVARIGSLQDDLEGHIVRQISENLHFSSIFLRMIFEELKKRFDFNSEKLIEFVRGSPIINQNRMDIIEMGIKAYFNNDHITCSHFLIPQIEDSVRNIIEVSNGNVLKKARGGGFHLRTFDELLRDEILITSLGEDFALYFRILFTDQRGWNLRNDVCHGTMDSGNFTVTVSDRIIHALMCFALIELREK